MQEVNVDSIEDVTGGLPPEPPIPSVPIPTLSQWGMIIMALLMVGFVVRRRGMQS